MNVMDQYFMDNPESVIYFVHSKLPWVSIPQGGYYWGYCSVRVWHFTKRGILPFKGGARC